MNAWRQIFAWEIVPLFIVLDSSKEGKFNGTSYQGQISVSYQSLVKAFGNPILTREAGYEADAEWLLYFPNTESYVTIYNYKTGRNYLGGDGDLVRDITDWHVGGFTSEAVSLVTEVLENRK